MDRITAGQLAEAAKGRILCGNPEVLVKHIQIDSHAVGEGDLFVPLIGARIDAHQFIEQAIASGAAAVLTSRHDRAESDRVWIRVEDTREALQNIGRWFRSRLSLPLIGVTGSVGKTTTREMIAAALSARYRVYKTPGNKNSQVGVPITISEISKEDEIGVIELGVSEPGEMRRIAGIARVNQAVMTNIGVAHIGQFGTQEHIFQEKVQIQADMAPGGILFVNGDDLILQKAAAGEGCRRILYGIGENCDYQAVDLQKEEGFPVFTAVDKARGENVRVKLSVLGEHMVGNAMVALAVARENGIPMEEAAAALEQFHGLPGRQQIYRGRDMVIVDDSYNASPVSMKAGIGVLCDLPAKGQRIAVLADMKELGENEVRYHREIGEFLAGQPVDRVVLLGELAAEIGKAMEEKELAAGGEGKRPVYFREKEALADWLAQEIHAGDVVLFKGSNSMGLSSVVRRFLPDVLQQ